MHVAITARHTHLTESMKGHVEERILKLERLLDPPVSANVVLSVEKYRQSAELTLQGNGFTFHGAGVTDDLYVAVDRAVDKVRRQIEKHKDRFVSARVRENKRRSETAKLQVTDSDDHTETAFEEDEPAALARLGQAPPVVKTHPVSFKPMSVEEATLQLIAKEYQFFVFQNASTEEMNVVYLLDNGGMGLIVPART